MSAHTTGTSFPCPPRVRPGFSPLQTLLQLHGVLQAASRPGLAGEEQLRARAALLQQLPTLRGQAPPPPVPKRVRQPAPSKAQLSLLIFN